ncbi:hypothetical protein HPB50_027979 [Hyalomma asiaticum]|nr:hypothetical protein HPB50_027979 [Hyalomma asiaticum]
MRRHNVDHWMARLEAKKSFDSAVHQLQLKHLSPGFHVNEVREYGAVRPASKGGPTNAKHTLCYRGKVSGQPRRLFVGSAWPLPTGSLRCRKGESGKQRLCLTSIRLASSTSTSKRATPGQLWFPNQLRRRSSSQECFGKGGAGHGEGRGKTARRLAETQTSVRTAIVPKVKTSCGHNAVSKTSFEEALHRREASAKRGAGHGEGRSTKARRLIETPTPVRTGQYEALGASSGNIKGLQEGQLCTLNIVFPPVLQLLQEPALCGWRCRGLAAEELPLEFLFLVAAGRTGGCKEAALFFDDGNFTRRHHMRSGMDLPTRVRDPGCSIAP